MIGWGKPPTEQDESAPRSFDDFDLHLGDVMRGERATMGKSLLDVQRELKIKATYVAAIENADVSAFSSPGFIAGYVRSYARYLGLDPEWAFETFCHEAAFTPVTGMTKPGVGDGASRVPVKGPVFRAKPAQVPEAERDPIAQPRVSFVPAAQGPFSGIEPRAIGSTLVLFALIGAIGYGGWSVLKEVQRVSVAPVEQAPEAVAQVDPLAGVTFPEAATSDTSGGIAGTAPDALDRLYRPQPLDTPVMIARDGPIASIDPGQFGVFADLGVSQSPYALDGETSGPAEGEFLGGPDPIDIAIADVVTGTSPEGAAVGGGVDPAGLRVTSEVPEVLLVAVEPAWVRVRAGDGSVLLERILEPGDTWAVPATEAPPTLRTGAAGAIFFAVNGQTYGPAGPNGAVVDGIALNSGALSQDFAVADPAVSDAAREAVAVAEAALTAPVTGPAEAPAPAEGVFLPTE